MVDLQVASPTLDKFRARWASAPQIVGEEWRAGFERLAPLAKAAVVAKIRARTKRRTGRYEGSVQVRLSGSGAFAQITVSSNAPYAGYIERGTRPHLIRAKRRGGKLRFEVGGRTLFRESVRHPGTRPRWVFRDAMSDFRPQATRLMAARLGNVTRRLKV